MIRFLSGCGIGVLFGLLLGHVLPIEVFMIACLFLMVLAVIVFILFHLGVQDFQD